MFYVLIVNNFGKHRLIGLRLWLRLGLGLEWTAGACVTAVSGILLDSTENSEHVIKTPKGTFLVTMRRLRSVCYVMGMRML